MVTDAREARTAMGVLLNQERTLRFQGVFGVHEALELGCAAIDAPRSFDHGVSVTIMREDDALVLFQWVADDCDERNLVFANGKRAAATKAGHASPWAQLEAASVGQDSMSVWSDVPADVPACGIFRSASGTSGWRPSP